MELSADIAPVIANSIALVFVAIVATIVLVIKLRPNRPNGDDEGHKFYEDEDGIATERSQKEYSASRPSYLLLASSAVGTLIALAGSILTTIRPDQGRFVECWIMFGSWVDGKNGVENLQADRGNRLYSFLWHWLYLWTVNL